MTPNLFYNRLSRSIEPDQGVSMFEKPAKAKKDKADSKPRPKDKVPYIIFV